MAIIKAFDILGFGVMILMTLLYFYQVVYTAVGLLRRRVKPQPEAKRCHRFAALISARNESGVIAQLVESLKRQKYPAECLDIYVLADNCSDDTAKRARAAGARVYERFDRAHVGKGYALDYLLKRIKGDPAIQPYEGYFVFDADNIVDENFVAEMNKTFDQGYQAVTCYRNSKNFGANWISAGYSIWFLREARFLNYPRMLLHNGCAVSGTGFLVSDALVEKNGGWPFHLLTEDIQFSIHCAVEGVKIGYCDGAMVYDEQPTSFRQSWRQRMRWSKGFYQVDARYMGPLVKGIFKNKGGRMTCYDMLLTIAPCMLLTAATAFFVVLLAAGSFALPRFLMRLMQHKLLDAFVSAALSYYVGMLIYGILTVACEWKRIPASPWQKVRYIWAFPLFMATYIPITLAALVRRVEWAPIHHCAAAGPIGQREPERAAKYSK